MTQDEIIEMWNSIIKYARGEVRITEFAKLVAAKERKACVLECADFIDSKFDICPYSGEVVSYADGGQLKEHFGIEE